MNRSRAFTLIELLVVLAILSVIGSGIFIAYKFIVERSVSSALIAKSEQESVSLIHQLITDIKSAGFGVLDSDGNPSNANGTIDKAYGTNGTIPSGSLSTFATIDINSADSGFIAISTTDPDRNELYFFSLAVRSSSNSGCWGYIDNDGCLNIQSLTFLGSPCDPSALTGTNVVVLSPTTKGLLSDVSCNTDTACPSDVRCSYSLGALVFFKGSNNYISDFATHYFLRSDTNQPAYCAPGTYTLYKRVYPDPAQPVISCVAAFRVRYIYSVPPQPPRSTYTYEYIDSISSSVCSPFNNCNNSRFIKGIRLCLIVQVGSKGSAERGIPSFSTDCGGALFSANSSWRWYRWNVIELDIPIRNIGNAGS